MLKPVATLAAAGLLGLALWKILGIVLFPLFGTLLGFLVTILKLAVVVALVLFAVWLFRKPKDDEAKPE